MEQAERRNRNFIAYEYKEVTADIAQASFLMDGYVNFGWEIDENVMPDTTEKYSAKTGTHQHRKTVIRLKRDRKILNKMELTRLQRNFDSCMEEILGLEASKRSGPTSVAIATGVLGTVCMAGSVFAITAEQPMMPLCILLAIPGILGWILPWFLYRWLVRRRSKKLAPIIEGKYDELYAVCEKGSDLLL